MKNGTVKSKRRIGGNSTRNRRKAVTKQISRVMDDENTTNSEASEHAVFSDINWEDNLEVDTTSLLEEFAPQAISRTTNISTIASEEKKDVVYPIVKEIETNKAEEFELLDVESPSDFDIGLKLLIQNYKTNEWIEGVVEETDMEEEEILIKYENGSACPEEWLSMSSQRIKRKRTVPKPSPSKMVRQSVDKVTKPVNSASKPIIKSEPAILPVPPPPISSNTSSKAPKSNRPPKRKLTKAKVKGAIKKPPFKKSYALSSKMKQRGKVQQVSGKVSRRLPVWKAHLSLAGGVNSSSTAVSSRAFKFSEGEKVLAKWSDHRMQKFPAVIRRVCGGGLYDVLFYDGFEKTIVEENLFKTSEEEIAKYKECKPSEADSFIDMDVESKHERRQKKRKTFDDFFEEKDLKRKKKPNPYDLNRSESFLRASLSRSKPVIQSLSVHARRGSVSTSKPEPVSSTPKPPSNSILKTSPISVPNSPLVSIPKSSISSPKSSISTPKSSNSAPKPSIFSPKSSNSTPKHSLVPTPKLLPPVSDSSISQSSSLGTLAGIAAPDPYPTSQDSTVTQLPVECKTDKAIENQELKHDSKEIPNPVVSNSSLFLPLEITCHDGVIRKSILIEDRKLPPGWTKHVIAWVENVWACFLFTPDRYAVHSLIELKKYFRITDAKEPPEGLDFSFPKESLQDLAIAQNHLVPRADYRKWVNKILDERKVIKKVRILPPSRTVGSSHYGTKRVRTLLPRYRTHTFSQGPNIKTLEGKVWRCPKSDCNKKFRKENLLHMHIKHYHVELSELAEKAPNVVDLALARSSADGVFTADPSLTKRLAPKSPVYERLFDKVSELSAPASEVSTAVPGGSVNKVSEGPFPQISLPSSNASPGQTLPGSLKVLSPAKIIAEPTNSDIEMTLNEKPRSHATPKLNLKKFNENKSLDESYITASRGVKRKQQISDKIYTVDSIDAIEDGEILKDSSVILERLQSEEIINCICGFKEEDGLMVQCEVCLCWQHGACHGMESDMDVPERYVCTICLDPMHGRSSQRYSYANHYLTLTKLPRFNYRTCKEGVLRHRETILSKSFELTSNLQSIHKMERTLMAKINIAQEKDHPKLYLWSTNWDSSKRRQLPANVKKLNADIPDKSRRGPVGEEPIESVDCRLRLLDRIEADQQDIESRLTIIQAQLQALESEDFDIGGEIRESNGSDSRLKQAVYMLLRDLSTVATAASLS